MENSQHVLCAIEVGPGAEEPLRVADRIARRIGAQLTVLHVIPDGYPGVPMSPEGLEQTLIEQQDLGREVGDYLAESVASMTSRQGDDVEIEVEAGVPHDLIVKRAGELNAVLVVLASSSHGGSQHGLLGSVATHVARHAPTSVLITRSPHAGGHVVAATDFSEPAAIAVLEACHEARDRHAPLLLMHSLDAPMPGVVIGDPGLAPAVTLPGEGALELLPAARARLAELLSNVDGPSETLVVEDPPAVAIADAAARLGADLVVVGGSQRSSFGRLVLGSVADAVVRDVSCSVLVAKSPLEVTAHN